MRRFLFALTPVFLFTAVCAAQPTASASPLKMIRFTGAVPVAGVAPNRVVGLTFSVYKDQTGGTPLWTEIQNVTLDLQGRYTVLLGSNTGQGLPSDLFLNGDARWIGVRVEQDPELARVLLVSVPYALKAGDANTFGGHPLSDFVLTGGTASGGGPSVRPSAVNSVPGVVTPAATVANGTPNTLAAYDGTGANVTSTNFSVVNNTLGLGTSTPNTAYVLDTNGAIRTNSAIVVESASARVRVHDTGVTSFWEFQPSAFVTDTFGFLRYENNTAVPAKSFVVTSAGNMGVGTPFPANKFSVNGVIESLSGGIKFPDGTLQTTAASGGATGGGTVSRVSAGTGLVASPNPITNTGTIALDLNALDARYLQASPSASYSNSNMTGRYAFSVAGGFAIGNSVYVGTESGTFQADGNGNIFNGSFAEHSSAGDCQGTFTGTYSVGSSGSGSAVIHTTTSTLGCNGATSTFTIEVALEGASVVFAETDAVYWLAGSAFRQ